MTDASLPAGRFTEGEFRVGHVLSRAWSVFSGNFLKFSVVAGIAVLPSLLIPQPSVANVGNPFVNMPLILTALFLMVGLTMVSQAIMFYAAFQDMRRKPVNLTDGLKVGLSRFFPLLGVGVVVVLAILGLLILAAVLFLVPGLKYGSPLIFVPVVMLFLMWSMGTPACVVERLGPFRSLGRSRELTKGHRWKILGLFLATMIPGVIIGAIVGAAMGVMLVFGQAGGVGAAAVQTISLIWNAIWTAFFAIVIAVAYHDLRVAKEGVDTDQIAAVFE
jgi:hypothetical protein